MNPFELKFFRFKSYQVAYIDEGIGEPILFLHNGGSSHRMFDRQLEYFSKSNRVIAMDWLGLGSSDKPREIKYNSQLYLDQITAITKHLGIRQFSLVGCCVGGAIAVMYAARHPQTVQTLTTVTLATPALTRKGILGLFLAQPNTLKYGVFNWLSRTRLAEHLVFSKIWRTQLCEAGFADEDYKNYSRALYSNPNVRNAFMAFDYFSMSEVDEGYAPSDFPPHLAIWGQENPVLPAIQGKQLVERWNAVQTLFLEGCGYSVLREATDRVNQSMRSHLAM